MRKTILIVLTMLMLIVPAYAAEVDAATDQPIQQEQEPVVVATLDELQAAIDTAEDGDTIALDATIKMLNGDTLVTDKHITLVRHKGFAGRMIEVYGDGAISGFSFVENGLVSSSTITTRAEGNGEITIENCSFKAAGDNGVLHFVMADIGDSVTIKGCTFYCGNGYVIYSQRDTNVLIDSCTFLKGNYYAWFMIASYGEMAVENCTFDAGTGYITASLDGKITISNCQMNTNYFKKRIYPNVYLEDKISGAGTIIILDEPTEGEGFYDLFTGEKVELPMAGLDDLSVLSYMTDEQAADYFNDESHMGRFDIKVDERSGHFDEDEPEEPDTNPEQPTNPDVDNPNNTDNPDNPDSGDQNTPQQPEQPPHNGNEDDPTDTHPEPPTEPPQDDTPDKSADTTPDTPQPPQKPSDSDNSGDDNYTPPVDYRPSQRPTSPSVTVKPTENSKPQTQPENNPVPAKPQLVCNGAVVDTSRTVVLLGYGDGLIHENDPLTRAQLATIIFRLLDDKSIALYSNTQLTFTDVAADAWYAQFVQTISGAGIVQGVGDGKYDPNGTVTWAQIITILTRFVEPQDYTLQHIQYSGWAVQAIQTAVANDWIKDRADFNPDAVIGRGELTQLINDVLVLYR